ncbi:MAG: cysteine hydrolase family protein [Bacillota bacterium]
MKRILLVVNMQNDYVRENGRLFCSDAVKIISFVEDKVREFVSERLPVVFILDAHDPDDIEFKRLPPHCVYGTEGAQTITELKALVEEYSFAIRVPKSRYSGFFRTNLSEILRDLKPEAIEVVGVSAESSVLYTVEELWNRDYNVIVFRDGIASFDTEAKKWAIGQMAGVLGAKIE